MSKLKSFIGETLIYGLGGIFSRVFVFFLIPLYTQYLGKEDYSNLIMLQSVFTILSFVLALNAGVFFYYYEYKTYKYKKIILTSWFYYQLVVSILLMVFLFLFSGFLSNFFIVNTANVETLKLCIALLGLQLLPYAFNTTYLNYFRIERKPKAATIVVLVEDAFTLLFVYVSLVFLNNGLLGIIVSLVLARASVAVLYLPKARIFINISNFSKKLLAKLVEYSWPFFLTSVFTWIIVSVDKFIGTQFLTNQSEVAILALAMQLTLPITILSDMIRMAIAPFVMSIRKDSDSDQSYQQIFDLSVFTSSFISIGLIMGTPFLTILLSDSSYLEVIFLVPLFAFAKVISIAANQFSISFSLVKKNVFIVYAIIIGGVIGVLLNLFFMKSFGYIVAGYSQIIAYLIMSAFLYFTGKKIAEMNIHIANSAIIISFMLIYTLATFIGSEKLVEGKYLTHILLGIITGILTIVSYLVANRINLKSLMLSILKKQKV